MASTFTVKGNIANDIILFNEEDIENNIENVRGVGTIFENRRNPETGKWDISDPYPFTIFGRQAVNLADTVEAIKDETGKYPRLILEAYVNSFFEEGENQKGETVDKTRIGLNVREAAVSLMWHTAMTEDDDHADASGRSARNARGRSGRSSTGRRRGRSPQTADDAEHDVDDTADEQEEQEEQEEARPRSRSSRSGGARSSRTSRAGGRSARTSRASGASRRSRASYDG